MTVAKIPEPDDISSKEKGTLEANLAMLSNAFAPSSVFFNKNFNLVLKFSISLPVETKFLMTTPAPSPISAD